MLIWKRFSDEKPKYNQTILFVPSAKYGLLFASITSLINTDAEGDHFSGWVSRAFPNYREEMWAELNPPDNQAAG